MIVADASMGKKQLQQRGNYSNLLNRETRFAFEQQKQQQKLPTKVPLFALLHSIVCENTERSHFIVIA